MQSVKIGADDYTIMVAAILAVGNAIGFAFTNKYGNGRHQSSLTRHELTSYWKTLYAEEQLYGCAITAARMSILLFYRRIFATQMFRIMTNTVGVFVLAWYIANSFTAIFQCTPVDKAWLVELPGHCLNQLNFYIGIGISNVILDAVLLVLPISAVLHLQMSTKKKIAVAAVFGLGGLSLVISILRLVYLAQEDLNDVTYQTEKCSWTVIEPAFYVLSACLPTMAPFLHQGSRSGKRHSRLRASLFHTKVSPTNTEISFKEIEGQHLSLPQYPGHASSYHASVLPLDRSEESSKGDLASDVLRHNLDWIATR